MVGNLNFFENVCFSNLLGVFFKIEFRGMVYKQQQTSASPVVRPVRTLSLGHQTIVELLKKKAGQG